MLYVIQMPWDAIPTFGYRLTDTQRHCLIKLSFLGVERIELKEINTFKFLGVNLLKCDLVVGPLEYVDFFHHLQGALSEGPLLGDGHLRVVVTLGGLAVLCVRKDNKRDPKSVNLSPVKTVEGPRHFEVVELESVIKPDHDESELEDKDEVLLRDAEHVHHREGNIDIDWDHLGLDVVKCKGGNFSVVSTLHHQHLTVVLI